MAPLINSFYYFLSENVRNSDEARDSGRRTVSVCDATQSARGVRVGAGDLLPERSLQAPAGTVPLKCVV